MRSVLLAVALATFPLGLTMNAQAQTKIPAALEAAGESVVLTLHAEGAQVYEAKPDESGKLAWVLREPTATLIDNGKTVGRHYGGPNWELNDSSAIVGKAVANVPGTTDRDIPWLKIDVVSHRGSGQLSDVTTVQRINTKGGKADAAPTTAGALLSVAYSADYVFLKKN